MISQLRSLSIQIQAKIRVRFEKDKLKTRGPNSKIVKEGKKGGRWPGP